MGKAKKKRCATRLLCGRRWTVNEDAMLREAVGGFMIDDVSSAVTEKETEGSKRKRCSNSGSQRIDWKHISRVCMASKRSAPECQNRWEKVLGQGLVKGAFSKEEDNMIRQCIDQGVPRWSEIAEHIPGRVGKQCRERWYNHLDPCLKHNIAWLPIEDDILSEACDVWGTCWSKICKLLHGRSANMCKNRWNGSCRRKNQGFGSRKGRSLYLPDLHSDAKDIPLELLHTNASDEFLEVVRFARREAKILLEGEGAASSPAGGCSTASDNSGGDTDLVQIKSGSTTKHRAHRVTPNSCRKGADHVQIEDMPSLPGIDPSYIPEDLMADEGFMIDIQNHYASINATTFSSPKKKSKMEDSTVYEYYDTEDVRFNLSLFSKSDDFGDNESAIHTCDDLLSNEEILAFDSKEKQENSVICSPKNGIILLPSNVPSCTVRWVTEEGPTTLHKYRTYTPVGIQSVMKLKKCSKKPNLPKLVKSPIFVGYTPMVSAPFMRYNSYETSTEFQNNNEPSLDDESGELEGIEIRNTPIAKEVATGIASGCTVISTPVFANHDDNILSIFRTPEERKLILSSSRYPGSHQSSNKFSTFFASPCHSIATPNTSGSTTISSKSILQKSIKTLPVPFDRKSKEIIDVKKMFQKQLHNAIINDNENVDNMVPSSDLLFSMSPPMLKRNSLSSIGESKRHAKIDKCGYRETGQRVDTNAACASSEPGAVSDPCSGTLAATTQQDIQVHSPLNIEKGLKEYMSDQEPSLDSVITLRSPLLCAASPTFSLSSPIFTYNV